MYHLMNGGKSQHPDAMFRPSEKLVMQPGAVYEPSGSMWMLAICGFGGSEGWNQAVRSLEP